MEYDLIEQRMKLWRDNFAPFPKEYIEYHRTLANAELERLQSKVGVTVHRRWMASGRWMDGMQNLHAVIETRSGKLYKIRWNDSNKTGHFFQVHPGAGASLIGSDKFYQ